MTLKSLAKTFLQHDTDKTAKEVGNKWSRIRCLVCFFRSFFVYEIRNLSLLRRMVCWIKNSSDTTDESIIVSDLMECINKGVWAFCKDRHVEILEINGNVRFLSSLTNT